ncbi:hypothetical protein ACIRSS_24090 [Amycolatopsis sp. NPDC101161]|uniref:hypothetical protein n=1 Tax=Amycolatopsis sp. NPDC101161 TaxID=3363940 RepID=UPI00382A0F76
MRLHTMAVVAAMAGVVISTTAATTCDVTVSDPHVVVHLDESAGQTPEAVEVEPDGSADISFSAAGQVARVTLGGQVQVLGRLPRTGNCPVAGAPSSMGLARSSDGALYVLDCTGDANTGVWRISRGQAPVQLAALPPSGFPNGMVLDQLRGQLYIADSTLATVWRVPIGGGTPVAWATDPALARTSFLGANGISLHGGAVWVGNTDHGTILRIPMRPDGSAGAVQTVASGLGAVDSFTFVPGTDLVLVALPLADQIVLVHPDGRVRTLLTAADGLSGPTAVKVSNGTVYVCDGAVLSHIDPNLLVAHIDY